MYKTKTSSWKLAERQETISSMLNWFLLARLHYIPVKTFSKSRKDWISIAKNPFRRTLNFWLNISIKITITSGLNFVHTNKYLLVPGMKNGQTYKSNSAANSAELLLWVWPFSTPGTNRAKWQESNAQMRVVQHTI